MMPTAAEVILPHQIFHKNGFHTLIEFNEFYHYFRILISMENILDPTKFSFKIIIS